MFYVENLVLFFFLQLDIINNSLGIWIIERKADNKIVKLIVGKEWLTLNKKVLCSIESKANAYLVTKFLIFWPPFKASSSVGENIW